MRISAKAKIKAMILGIALFLEANTGHSQAIMTPDGAPADYYAGLANGVPASQRTQWQQWAQARKPAILALRARIEAARARGQVPGCIGRSVEDCIVTLTQDLAIADDYMNSHLLDTPETDVNGKPIFPKLVEIYAFRPGATGEPQGPAQQIPYLQEQHPLFLHLSNANKITEISVGDVMNSILLAKTQADYDQTAIYEILAPQVRARCPKLSRLELDRFIENKLKTPARHARAIGPAKSYIRTQSSPLLPFCGLKLKFEIELDRSRWPHQNAQIGAMLIIR